MKYILIVNLISPVHALANLKYLFSRDFLAYETEWNLPCSFLALYKHIYIDAAICSSLQGSETRFCSRSSDCTLNSNTSQLNFILDFYDMEDDVSQLNNIL